MGSYITIVNNTPDVWQCKVSYDQKALMVGSMMNAVLGSFLFTLAAFVSIVPLITPLAVGGVLITVLGLGPTFMKTIDVTEKVSNVIGGISLFTRTSANMVSTELSQRGYDEILPHGRRRYGKMTLSLWQQSQCVRIVFVDEKTLWLDTLNMRPIFSGATPNSNKNYDIESWIHRNGTITRNVIAAKKPVLRQLQQEEETEVYRISPNGKFINRRGVEVDLNI